MKRGLKKELNRLDLSRKQKIVQALELMIQAKNDLQSAINLITMEIANEAARKPTLWPKSDRTAPAKELGDGMRP